MNLKLLNILSSTLVEQQDDNPPFGQYRGEKGGSPGDITMDSNDSMVQLIKTYFQYLQSASVNVQEFVRIAEEEGMNHYNFPLLKELSDGMKYVGMEMANSPKANKHDIIYLLAINYLHNGGGSRNFKEGEINLIPTVRWDMVVETKQNVIELNTVYCDVYGTSREKAQDAIINDISGFEVDRETYDHEYGDGEQYGTDINEVNKIELKLHPEMFSKWSVEYNDVQKFHDAR
tara:strand:- start:311 stop:1006 length:696 start_codon:yes stop_codon:yes gene_type:complete